MCSFVIKVAFCLHKKLYKLIALVLSQVFNQTLKGGSKNLSSLLYNCFAALCQHNTHSSSIRQINVPLDQPTRLEALDQLGNGRRGHVHHFADLRDLWFAP